MQTALLTLRSHLEVLWDATSTAGGRKPTGTKTKRFKAVTAIYELLSKKSVVNALTAASKIEMIKGPQREPSDDPVPLGWAELACVIVVALDNACTESATSKSVSKSGVALLKPEYMKCFRTVVKQSLRYGPPGVIRHIIPAFLMFSHQWLSEPPLRSAAADQIWQVVRDLLQDEANRAMLTAPFIRTWVDVCYDQLTGLGPLKHVSSVVSSMAAEVLQLLATPTPSFDILTQSTRGVSVSKMQGGDYSYAIICERCCLMLLAAVSMRREEARELQVSCFRILGKILKHHAVSFIGSSALESIVNLSLKTILGCWNERRCHEPAVSLASILVLLAPSNKKMFDLLRSRFISDMDDQNSPAILRAAVDVEDVYFETAAVCFSFVEVMKFARNSVDRKSHMIVWLRIAFCIISRQVLKKGISTFVNTKDLNGQLASSMLYASEILQKYLSTRDNHYSEVIKWISKLVLAVNELMEKTHENGCLWTPYEKSAWEGIYAELLSHATRANPDWQPKGTLVKSDVHQDWFDSLAQAQSYICSGSSFEPSRSYSLCTSSEEAERPVHYPFSRLMKGEKRLSFHEVKYIRNLIGKTGVPNSVARHLRYQFSHSLLNACEFKSPLYENSSARILDASSAILGITRGECSLHNESCNGNSDKLSRAQGEMNSVFSLNCFFCMSMDEPTISRNGDRMVEEVFRQIQIWEESPLELKRALDFSEVLVSTTPSAFYVKKDRPSITRGRHFSVSRHESQSLELEMLSRIKLDLISVLTAHDEVEKRCRKEIPENVLEDDGTGLYDLSAVDLCGLRTISEVEYGLKVAIFVGNYITEGLRLGLLSTGSNSHNDGNIKQLISLTSLVLQKLSKTQAILMIVPFELLKTTIAISARLVRHIESDVRLQKVEKAAIDYLELRETIIEAVKCLSLGLCELLATTVEERTKRDVKIIESFSLNPSSYESTNAVSGNKRQGRLLASSAKRRRLSPNVLAIGSQEDSCSPADSREVDEDSQAALQRGIDSMSSSEDSDSFLKRAGQSFTQSPHAKKRRADAHVLEVKTIRKVSSVLSFIISQFHEVSEIVFETSKRSLSVIEDVRLTLSPDDFERGSLLSNLVDADSLAMRECFWCILLSIGKLSSLLTAAEDILRFGRLWKDAEEISQSYVGFYVECVEVGKRKQYPLPLHLEVARVSYLEHARIFMLRCAERGISGKISQGLKSSDGRLLRLITGMAEIADLFRSKHAFRMPRVARASYLRFGVSAIEMRSSCIQSLPDSGHDVIALSSLRKLLKCTENAMVKFLSDADGSVRSLAAYSLPRLVCLIPFPRASEAELFIKTFLPSRSSCVDNFISFKELRSRQVIQAGEDNSQPELDLDARQAEYEKVINESFTCIGSTAKGYAALMALAEAAAYKPELIPFLYVELFERVLDNPKLLVTAYMVLVRLCVLMRYESPKHLFDAHARLVLHKWFHCSDFVTTLFSFPVCILLDSNHHKEGIRYDWMRDHQSRLIPFLLVHECSKEGPILGLIRQVAKDLHTDLPTLLSKNVASFSLVYPMHFVDSMHAHARKLWRAIDDCVEGKTMQLISQNRSSVTNFLLQSVYANTGTGSPFGEGPTEVEAGLGFSRDTRDLRPPLYDPLVIALSINQLYGSESKFFMLSRSALLGSIFSKVKDRANESLFTSWFAAFLKECERKSSTLLQMLLTISQMLIGVPARQPSQNRSDAFFCLGMLWRMLGCAILRKSVVERRVFYTLLARGFEYTETASNAAWLLLSIQSELATLQENEHSETSIQVNLGLVYSRCRHLSGLVLMRDQQLYELLNTASPVLVSVLLKSESEVCALHKEVTSKALKGLLLLCEEKRAWCSIVANGPFPALREFSRVRKIYNNAQKQANFELGQGKIDNVLNSLTHFQEAYALQGGKASQTIFLGFLEAINTQLTESVVRSISRRMRGEAWMRSCGLEHSTSSRIASAISAIIDLIHVVVGAKPVISGKQRGLLDCDSSSSRAASFNEELKGAILRESSFALCTLGFLNFYAPTFISTNSSHRTIPAQAVFGKFEDVESGIKLIMLLLQDLIISSTPIVAQSALSALTGALQTKDGWQAHYNNKELFQAISFLRSSGRGKEVQAASESVETLVDPHNGDEISFNELPEISNPQLWSIEHNGGNETHSYEKWICTLCSVLARNCRSKAMKALSSLCFASYHSSCEALPYLLMDTICDFDSSTLSLVSNFMRELILKKQTTPKAIRRLFVHTLDVLSQIGLDVLFAHGVCDWFQKTARTYTFPCYYVFEIPYDEAAMAALKCGAYFSALRFAQLFVDQEETQFEFSRPPKQGRGKSRISGVPSLVESRREEARQKVLPIIREATHCLSEPDGKIAFAANEDLAIASANVASLNNDWMSCLGALEVANQTRYEDDLSSKRCSLKPSSIFSTRGQHLVDLVCEKQKLRSLIGLGTLHVAADYWEGLRRRLARISHEERKSVLCENHAIVDQLNDLRYAAAWKLQDWETPVPLTLGASVMEKAFRIGFHEAVYHILRSLKTERGRDASRWLVQARNSVLREIAGDVSAVSAGDVFHTAARLRVLDFLHSKTPEHFPHSSGMGSSLLVPGKVDGKPLCQLSGQNVLPTSDASYSGGLLSREDHTRGRKTSKSCAKRQWVSSDSDFLRELLDTSDSETGEETISLKDCFQNGILTEEIPSVLYRCLPDKSRTALAAAAVSARILSSESKGRWSRSAACLGTPRTSFLREATPSESIAWKLQESRLRWHSNHDARSRKEALKIVEDIITIDLQGIAKEVTVAKKGEDENSYQYLEWSAHRDENDLVYSLRVEACKLAAKWSLDMRTHEPMELFKFYLESALEAAQQSTESLKLGSRAHFAMASFADEQISSIDLYRKSGTYEKMVATLKDMESEVTRMKQIKEERFSLEKKTSAHNQLRSRRSQMISGTPNQKLSKELDGLIFNEQKKAKMERRRLEHLDRSRRKWQLLACKHFASCLKTDTKHDLRAAFRMVAIWLDSGLMREAITAALTQNTPGERSRDDVKVPGGKLLPLAPQLASRLNFSENFGANRFQPALACTITSMASQFPIHCLWQLLALSNSTRECASEGKYTAFYRGDKHKKEAAEDILKRLEAQHGRTYLEMKRVANAYILLSELSKKQKKSKEGKDSRMSLKGNQIMKLGELRHVAIPTIPLPLCASDHMGAPPYICGFEQHAVVCSGLSQPLRVICIGSDGEKYAQLVKGRDDLRGDAVMEQMFMIMNKLLQRDAEAAARRLHIRTYRIVPLSPFSGIMQFVDNTKQLKDVLTVGECSNNSKQSRKSLHERYRPKDMKHQAIFETSYRECDPHGRRDLVRLKKYLRSIWPRFQPVFHHYFIEKWPDPAEWYSHQLDYSRSVAVMSIVGFVLGLGDRHLSNVLLDSETAEVVHIDFGIAFEQGKLLSMPEHMPFRLTRDVVDGFGVAGVEGIFRRCCEITLGVVRQNKDVVLTVVDVLLHDPMFLWALTPEEILNEQDAAKGSDRDFFEESESSKSLPESALDAVVLKVDRDVNGSRDAQRAMSRVSEKLDGLEGTERLSIEAHVARLIDEASAFHVISSVFPPWCPWV